MRTRAIGVGATRAGRGPRRARGVRVRAVRLSIGLAGTLGFFLWTQPGSVHASVPGSPSCMPRPEADAIDYVTGRVCPPFGFAETMGYQPVLVRTANGWRYTKPGWAGGFCSPPMTDRGPFWDFTTACQAHDYGYDLVRFGVGDRTASDRLLFADMVADCSRRSIPAAAACWEVARMSGAVLKVGDTVGLEPGPVPHASGS